MFSLFAGRREVFVCFLSGLLFVPVVRGAEPAARQPNIFDFGKDEKPPAPAAAQPELRAVPDAAALAAAETGLRAKFAKQFADATNEGRIALGRQLLTHAADKSTEVAQSYAAILDARNLAIAAGDLALLNESLSALAKSFHVDDLAIRLAALQEFLAGKTYSPTTTARGLSQAAGKLADDAILRGKLDVAVSAAVVADGAAALTKDAEFIRLAAGRLADIRLLQAETVKTLPAVAKLEKSPDDPDANLAVGRFLCLWRGDWRQGLPLLAKGSDTTLKELAAEELAAAGDAPMQLAMGNAWWDFASKLEGPPRAYAQDHAADAYLQAIPNLEGIYKTMAQKRVAEAPARLPFPRPGAAESAAVRGAEPLATNIYIVADDFVATIYHNGVAVPNRDRKLLAEIYGAQIERVTLSLKPGDWVVFNIANNRLRWKGAYYFAAGFMNEKGALVYPSEMRTGYWSSCDDLKEIGKFVGERDHFKDHKPQPVTNPWDRGEASIKGGVPGWNGQAIWGAPTSQSTWIKFVAPEK